MIFPVVFGAVAATLAACSGRNMWDTHRIADQAMNSGGQSFVAPTTGILSQYLSPEGVLRTPAGRSTSDVVSDLRGMSRNELIALWMRCEAPPDAKFVEGEWNGKLLDNNGWVLTSVSKFLSNQLFGMGRKWNGKAFMDDGGENRFFPRGDDKEQCDDQKIMQREHRFDSSLSQSMIDPGSKSLTLQYCKYQSRISLWHTMRDEVRILRPGERDGEGGILLGLGCMAWSGAFYRDGMMNSSPFCLWRSGDKVIM